MPSVSASWFRRVIAVATAFGALGARLCAQPVDPTFNPNASSDVFGLAAQADGKILIAGNFTTIGGLPRAYIARLNPDGTADPGFNPGANTTVSTLVVQPDGRILVGGSFTTLGGSARVRLARLHPDGSLDSTFNAGADTSVLAMALQPDGKVLIGGIFGLINSTPRTVLARLNGDGSLDSSFNPVLAAPGSLQLRVDAIVALASGKILVGGSFTTIDGVSRPGLARLNANGSLDTTFNPNGGGADVSAIVVQPDGRLLIGGSFTSFGGLPRSRLARLTADGAIDDNVGVIGPSSIVRSILLQADGKFIVGGGFSAVSTSVRSNLARFNADGSLDSTFDVAVSGANGISAPGVTEIISPSASQVILAGTFSSVGGQPRNGVARLGAPTPVISTAARSLAFATGQPFELTVSNSSPGISYQWLRNGSPIAGATGSSFSAPGATASHAGSYTVVASSFFGTSTSSAAVVTIDSRTVYITQAPAGRNVNSGEDLSLNVVAAGRAPLTYQWQKDGAALAGATTSALVFGPALPEHAGTYTVVVTDAGSSVSSAPATVAVSGGTPFMVSTLAGRLGQPGSTDGPAGTAQLFSPNAITVDAAGYLYVADREAHAIRKISPQGEITTLAGSSGTPGFADGAGADARFNLPTGIAVDRAGNVFVADTSNNRIRKITPAGVVSTLAGGVQGNVDGTGAAARLGLPQGLAMDGDGNLYCTESLNHTVRKITPTGVVTLLAGLATVVGRADGVGTAARFSNPSGIAVDGAGNLFVADMNNHTIRRITPDGTVTTFAGEAGTSAVRDGPLATARFTFPQRLAFDPAGNLYVVSGVTVRRIDVDGVVTTPVGSGSASEFRDGVGATARFSTIMGIATDSLGNLYVSDRTNALVRKASLLGRKGARLANLSVRSVAGTGGDTLIVGFNVGGATNSLLLRAIGPTLTALGVGGALADPTLQLQRDGTIVAQNNDWDGASTELRNTAAQVGAFPLPAASRDAALLQTLASGSFTAQVGGGSGIALVEIYDATAGGGRLANISARTRAGTGAETLIVGFVVGGDTAKSVLIRAVGPTLAAFGVTGALANPQLTVTRDALPIATNSGWGNDAALAATFARVGAFALPAGSRDAAVALTLLPGAYTAQVATPASSGVALVEIYEVP